MGGNEEDKKKGKEEGGGRRKRRMEREGREEQSKTLFASERQRFQTSESDFPLVHGIVCV